MRREEMGKCAISAGMGAVLLLTASVQAAWPDPKDGSSSQVAQGPRPRGFDGFRDWDSRFGGYDRSRRAEDDKDGDRDQRRGRPGTGGRPSGSDDKKPDADKKPADG